MFCPTQLEWQFRINLNENCNPSADDSKRGCRQAIELGAWHVPWRGGVTKGSSGIEFQGQPASFNRLGPRAVSHGGQEARKGKFPHGPRSVPQFVGQG